MSCFEANGLDFFTLKITPSPLQGLKVLLEKKINFWTVCRRDVGLIAFCSAMFFNEDFLVEARYTSLTSVHRRTRIVTPSQ